MVQRKVKAWAPTKGTSYCHLKPRRWHQRADAYLRTQAKDDMCVLTWGGGAYDGTVVFVAVVVTIILGNDGFAHCVLQGQNGPSNTQENSHKSQTQLQLLMGVNCQAVA
eukprot:460131-Ditylum_brightwellii.AAC.1